MNRISQKRRNSFDLFYNNVKDIFTGLRDNDKRATFYQNEYMLNICPGSRHGGMDKAVVEVFWGSRLFDFVTSGRRWTTSTEYGASLVFIRNDTGYVTIYLYPARTDNREPVETAIILFRQLDPERLQSHSLMKCLWKSFMAYMEYTSLDGAPNLGQRLRIRYLRFSRHLVIDKKQVPTRLSTLGEQFMVWFFSVGCSGIVVAYISYRFLQPTSPTPTENKLDEVNRHLEQVQKQIDRFGVMTDTTTVLPVKPSSPVNDTSR